MGTSLEWYDFTIYNVMAALVFNVVFFPSFDPVAGTLLAFSTYAVGYFARPVGGLLFGHLGDRRGRRFVLVTTVVAMGAASFMIAVLPSYDRWGVWSPALLVALRFIQGATLGGEWAGAVLLSLEHGAERERGRNGSFAQMGPAFGSILGTGATALVSSCLTPDDFAHWGWRIPFALSLVLVAFGFWLRSGVDETPAFLRLESHRATARSPILDVLRGHRRPLITSIGARVGPDVVYALLVVFSLTYVTMVLHLSRSLPLGAALLGAACHAIAIPLFASLSDRIGRRPVCAAGAVLSALWTFAYFRLMNTRVPMFIALAVAGGMTLHAVSYGPQAAFIAEQFPARVRYAGASLAYTLTGVVAGGLAPLIFASIYHAYASTLLVSLYVTAALAITLIAFWHARETAHMPLAE